MDDFSRRVGSTLDLPRILEVTARSCSLGDILASAPILTGYQDYNMDLTTSRGRYVVKIFSEEKSKERIDDVMWAYAHSRALEVPVPALCPTADKRNLIEIPGVPHPSYLCVFEYFAGKPLTRVPITDTDLETLTKAMTTIHHISKTIHHYYDTMGIINLPEEFKKNSTALNPEELSTIAPIVAKLIRIKLSTFPHSIIHGTFEKENVLKNPAGDLCLLDFGCMDYNATVLDIATYIANFTLYLEKTKRDHVIHLILDTYQKVRSLTPSERAALPTLIRSQYAAYVVGMTYHMRIDHDMTKQTQAWLDRGWDGLRMYDKDKRIL